MSAKGGGKNCCCRGCATPMKDKVSIIPGFTSVEEAAVVPSGAPVFCLACMPIAVCVRVDCGGHANTMLWERNDPDCLIYQDEVNYKSFWSGWFFVNETAYRGRIIFDVDAAYSECYMCFQCLALGIQGTEPQARILVDSAVRSLLSTSCQNCTDFHYPPSTIEWHLTLGGCDAIVSVAPSDTAPLIAVDPCPGCLDPCYGSYASGIYPPSTIKSCETVCNGCDCIGSSACITVSVDGEFKGTDQVLMCNRIWATANGTVISVEPDYDGNCQLSLSAIGGVGAVQETLPLHVPIGTLGNPCPWPSATWSATTTDTPPKNVRVIFNSAECGDCAEERGGVCCPATVPRLLHATFDGSPCSCETLVIPIFDATLTGDSVWNGQSAPDAFSAVFSTGRTVMLALFCEGLTGWILRVSYDGGLHWDQYTAYSGSCDPVNFVFTGINAQGAGDCKCQPPFYPKCETLTCTITE